jgi:hypothetical protein
MELAKLASEEQDPKKPLELIKEINDLLEAKENRLLAQQDGRPTEKLKPSVIT